MARTRSGHKKAAAACSFLLNNTIPFQEIILLSVLVLDNATMCGWDLLFIPHFFLPCSFFSGTTNMAEKSPPYLEGSRHQAQHCENVG